MRRLCLLILALTLASCAVPPPGSPGAERFRFALVGDAPYHGAEIPVWNALLARLAGEGHAFLLHAGDIKGGSEPCSDALLAERIDQLRLPAVPLLLALGDNEWTDCHRKAAGSHSPLERLSVLRRLSHADPQRSLGARPMAVQTQALSGGLPEHQAFEWRGVRVASLHVVGSRNGLEPWGDIGDGVADSRERPRADRIAEVRARDAAVNAWLRLNVARAADPEVKALVLLFQANPGFEAPPGSPAREGFEPFLAELRSLLVPLRKPVLLAHGDHHQYLVDRPWSEAPWVQRVQTWGSPIVGGVRIRVIEGEPLRFELESVLQR